MKRAIRDPIELCRALDLPLDCEAEALSAAADFPVFAPLEYVEKMRLGDPHDPLLRQVLPLANETCEVAGFKADPVDDHAARMQPGLLQKYVGRVLLIATGACAIHCRYCFRRHYPYHEAPHSLEQWKPALDRIATDSSIDEVLLSGGDPLTLSDGRLSELARALAAIPHLRRLRIHTRLPIVIPQRVDSALLEWLTGGRLTPIVIVHANHADEIGEDVMRSLERLVDAGAMVLNQSVLLRGVNDSVETLEALSRRLLDARVLPYYLHQLDRVAGAAHFETPIEVGIRLIEELRRRLPGYAIPRFVRETPGDDSKQMLA